MTRRNSSAARANPQTDAPRPGVVPIATPLETARVRWAMRISEVADALGVSRRMIERERAAGRFPRPDLVIGRMPLWKPETIRALLERGGR